MHEIFRGGVSVLHENLRLKRKERGLSQEELASRLHVVRQTISKWEKGMSVPDSEQLIKIAVILETTVNELLGTKVENEEKPDWLVKELPRINTQLAIACAVFSGRRILILDEPTSSLDGKNMRLIAERLKSEARSGRTILVITHDRELIESCCDNIVEVEKRSS